MDGRRSAHHRVIHRHGPHHSWLQRKARHLAIYGGPGFVGVRIVNETRTIRPGLYEIPPSLMLQFREAVDKFGPYATDTEGTVWQ